MNKNVIISGPYGSSKTTMLNKLTSVYNPNHIYRSGTLDDSSLEKIKRTLSIKVLIVEEISLLEIIKWNIKLKNIKGLIVYYVTLDDCKAFDYTKDFVLVSCKYNLYVNDKNLAEAADKRLKTASKIVKNNVPVPFIINGNTSTMVMAKNVAEVEELIKKNHPEIEIKSIETLGSSETLHELKIHPSEFVSVCSNLKKAEFRSTKDRDFRVNDLLKLNEWEPEVKYYTGRSATVLITHIQSGFGIPEDHAMLSISMLAHNLNNKYSESKKMS